MINEYGTVDGMRIGRSKWSTWKKKTCPGANLSATNSAWGDPNSKSGCRCGKSVNARAIYATACDNPVVLRLIAIVQLFVTFQLQLYNELSRDNIG
jgi:hypothetical protein